MINIIRINETERGKEYQLRINKRDIEIMITWHAGEEVLFSCTEQFCIE